MSTLEERKATGAARVKELGAEVAKLKAEHEAVRSSGDTSRDRQAALFPVEPKNVMGRTGGER